MEHIINAKNTTVTPAIKAYIEKRFAKFIKYVNDDITVYTKIEVKYGGLRHKVEVTIPFGKQTIRAEANDTDMYAAIDEVEKILSRILKKRKEKLTQRYQSAGPVTVSDEEVAPMYEISRVKNHKLSAMTAQEACESMDMVGHPFYAYFDIDDNKPCIVYARENDTYGKLIFD
jgi:putative sigma-54 modulation protein